MSKKIFTFISLYKFFLKIKLLLPSKIDSTKTFILSFKYILSALSGKYIF